MPIHNIDVATGTVAFDQADIGLPGVLPLSFIRHYSTANLQRSAELGPGWSHNFDHRLTKTLEGWEYTDERGVVSPILGNSPGFELEEREHKVWLRRYTSGNPNLWMVFECIADEYRLIRLQLLSQQRIELQRDLRTGRILTINHARSGRSFRLIYEGGLLHNVFLCFPHDPAELLITFEYDASKLIKVYDLQGIKTSFEYDEHGCVTKVSKRSGTEQVFEYDKRLRCVHSQGKDGFEARWMSYDEASRTTKVKDSKGNESVYVCNAFGQVLKETLPNGAVTRRRYDDRGNLISSTGPLGNTVERRYDHWGRLTEIVSDRKQTWSIEYNGDHRIRMVKLPNGMTWQYLYAGDLLDTSIGPHGHRWTYGYNLFSELTGVRDPLGNRATRIYDDQGNVVETISGTTVRKYEYDRYGRCVKEVGDSVIFRTYDKFGQLVALERDGSRWEYVYENGRIVERRGPNGIWKASWMGCGCLSRVDRPDGAAVELLWGDEPNQLLKLIDGEGRGIRWTYDAMGKPVERQHWDGRVAKYTFDVAGNPIKVTDGERTFECQFDKNNNLTKFVPHEGKPIFYEYDLLDRLVAAVGDDVELWFERDAYGAVLKETSTTEKNEFVLRRWRDALGRPTRVKLDTIETEWFWKGSFIEAIDHGVETWTVDHDDFGRETVRATVGGVLHQEYDTFGNLRRQVVEREGRIVYEAFYGYSDGKLVDFTDTFGEQQFIVDKLDRLNGWFWASGTASVDIYRTHDAAGNVVQERLKDFEEHTYDNDVQFNRTEKVWDPYTDNVALYDYDDRGFVVRRQYMGQDVRFEWSSMGLLTSVVVDGKRWDYTYDPFGRRIRKDGPGGTWTYLWDDMRIVAIRGPQQSIEYVYRPYGVTPIAFKTEGRTWDLVPRPQGTAAIAISDKGKPVNLHAHLDPWLRPIGEVEAAKHMGFPNQEGFLGSPGQFLDPETGLYYNVHRYYDPMLSKFISPDPTGLLGGMNEYAWVPNPMGWIDPLGLSYVSGGPLPWRPGENARNNGRPNLGDPDNRFVDVNGRERVVKKRSENDNGKCMTVVDGVPDSALPLDRGFQPGDSPVFISGEGRPFETANPSNFDVRADQMGNWCHGEIQALHFLVQNDISGATVWVDRPPCSMCAGDLDAILGAHFPGGDGRSVTVMYFDQEAGWETWDQYKKRTAKPCGG